MTVLMTEVDKAVVPMVPSRIEKTRAWLGAVNWGAVIARTAAPALGIALFLFVWAAVSHYRADLPGPEAT